MFTDIVKLGLLILITQTVVNLVMGRIFERCELGFELNDTGIYPNRWVEDISKWLCISNHSTEYNTSFENTSGPIRTYGILKISQDWCDDGGSGSVNRCNVLCEQLQTDNISETVRCASQIYRVENSWCDFSPAFQDHCMDNDTTPYVTGCERELTFTSDGGDIEIVENTTSKLTCSVKGYPAPSLLWDWDGKEENPPHIHPEYEPAPIDIEYVAYLTIENASFSDTKPYTCTAFNGLRPPEEKPQVFNVTVVPFPGVITTETDVTVTETSEATVTPTETEETTSIGTEETFPGTEETTSTGTEATESTGTGTTESSTQASSETFPDITTTEFVTSPQTSTNTQMTQRTTTIVPIPTAPTGPPKRYTACDLARILTNEYNDTYNWNDNLSSWICIAKEGTSLNGSYLHFSPQDPNLVYYGILKISNKWCEDDYNMESPCNASCTEMFHENLKASAACAKHIFDQKGFSEWEEYEGICEQGLPPDELQWCTQPPFFAFGSEDDIEKYFELNSENKNITCSAQGYPPPLLEWDQGTLQRIRESNGRLYQQPIRRVEDLDGNVTIQSTIIFKTVWKVDEKVYECEASNSVGSANRTYTVYVTSKGSNWRQILTVGAGIALGLLGLFAIPITYIIYRLRRKRNQNLARLYREFHYGSESSGSAITDATYLSEFSMYQRCLDQPFNRAFEILPYNLEVNEEAILGSGAFGTVFQGKLDHYKTVAVKTVKQDADQSHLEALLCEVKIMSYVGKHRNIVQFIGAQTIDIKKGVVFVVVEYCPYGSLEGVLQKKRNELAAAYSARPRPMVQNQQGYLAYISSGYVPANAALNRAKTNVTPFSTQQLLSFAHQVTCGMEYLASKKIIHGDLASRNVLLDAHFVCKITDFGLSRKIYDTYKDYVTASRHTALPWRWLAIETLRELKFSTESDIWAFGIFMWEVFSLAELPYSGGISWSPEFLDYLEQGFRLQQPKYATLEIYQLMKMCWEQDPFKRIGFQEMTIRLLQLNSGYQTAAANFNSNPHYADEFGKLGYSQPPTYKQIQFPSSMEYGPKAMNFNLRRKYE